MVADKLSDRQFIAQLRNLGLKMEDERTGKKFMGTGNNAKDAMVRGCRFKIRLAETS
jgi:hypothetical protein